MPTSRRSAATCRPSSASSPTRSWRSAPSRMRRKGRSHRDRGRLRDEIAQARRAFADEWAHQWTSDQFPLRPERILSELQAGAARRRLRRHRRRLEQERRRAAVRDHRAGNVRDAERAGDDGVRAGGGARREGARSPIAPRLRSSAMAGSDPIRRSSRRRWKPVCNVVWLVMDNAAFGTIAGLEQMHYGTEFGCVFECDGQPYRVDFAAMARACGRAGVMVQSADELGPALTRGARARTARRHSGADGERADADARPLEHQRHLSKRRVEPRTCNGRAHTCCERESFTHQGSCQQAARSRFMASATFQQVDRLKRFLAVHRDAKRWPAAAIS